MTTGTYLLHLDPPYRHARHYLGWSSSIEARVERHARGRGARLVEVAMRAGSGVSLVRTWPGTLRDNERRLKGSSAVRLCPVCTPGAGAGRWPILELGRHRGVIELPAGVRLHPSTARILNRSSRCRACRARAIVVLPRGRPPYVRHLATRSTTERIAPILVVGPGVGPRRGRRPTDEALARDGLTG